MSFLLIFMKRVAIINRQHFLETQYFGILALSKYLMIAWYEARAWWGALPRCSPWSRSTWRAPPSAGGYRPARCPSRPAQTCALAPTQAQELIKSKFQKYITIRSSLKLYWRSSTTAWTNHMWTIGICNPPIGWMLVKPDDLHHNSNKIGQWITSYLLST